MLPSPSDRTHRFLLPKPDRSGAASARGDSSTASRTTTPSTHKSSATLLACNACRSRKIKCDGLRPTCAVCARRRLQCVYRDIQEKDISRENSDLRKTTHDLTRILNYLQDAPEEAATAALMNLRSGKTSLARLSATIESGTVSADSPSISSSSGAQGGSLLSTLELELNYRYPSAFPVIAPLGVGDINLQLLDVNTMTVTPELKSRKRRFNSRKKAPPSPIPVASTSLSVSDESIQWDERLYSVDFKLWTSVDIPNRLAASAISFYLRNEHPVLALFDADAIIDDLVRGKGPLCSPLLLSSILAWSCAGISQSNPKAKQLSCDFLEEAKLRWSNRQREDLDTVSAAILMALTCNHHGNDREGLIYLDASAEIGRRLELFNFSLTSTSSRYDNDESRKAAASFAAWGSFAWNTLDSVHFRRRHRLRSPPTLPIPGMTTDGGPALPAYMGNTFTSVAKLWLVVYEIWGDGYHEYANPTLERAEMAYQKLLLWSGELAPDMWREETCSAHHVLILHIWYHTAIMDVWRPFLGIEPQTRLTSFNSEDNWPTVAYLESVRQLKRLIYVYRQAFETLNPTMLVTPGYLYLINEIFRDSDSPEAQFYFIFAMCGCLSMAPWCRGLCGITKAFFGLGWQTGLLRRADWNIGRLKSMQAQVAAVDAGSTYNSVYPIDLERADRDAGEGGLEALASLFQKIAVASASDKESDGSDENNVPQKLKFWTGDPRDLDLTLTKATEE